MENTREVSSDDGVIEGEVVSVSSQETAVETSPATEPAEGQNLPVASGEMPVPLGQGIDETNDALGLIRWGKVIVASKVFAQFRSPYEVAVAVLAGRERGLSAIESLNCLFFVNGRPTWTANALAGFIKKSGRYNYRVKTMTDTVCELTFFENGEEAGVSTFTIKDATQAGLTGKDVWRKFPRNMLFARAISNGIKWFAPDLIAGGAYVVGELDN